MLCLSRVQDGPLLEGWLVRYYSSLAQGWLGTGFGEARITPHAQNEFQAVELPKYLSAREG